MHVNVLPSGLLVGNIARCRQITSKGENIRDFYDPVSIRFTEGTGDSEEKWYRRILHPLSVLVRHLAKPEEGR
jgi:hypothetical protein